MTGLVTCGIWSEYCIANTTIAALEQGYQTCVASDAHSTVAGSNSKAVRKIEEQNALLKSKNAQLLTVSQLAESLRNK
ncbi:MAG: isochorismatase family protein [Gammaproteobacteria bacterium]|nr:isochorismatase family protein [Gammaproteobacteria bacterium]MBL4729380.1 isochorismatase family protein [Gammaproteobacteria bacterium]